MSCPQSIDASFGPWAGPNCRGGVDFTLRFELIWFSYVPSAILILGTLWLLKFVHLPLKHEARSGLLRLSKLVVLSALGISNVVCLALVCIAPNKNEWKTAAGAASLELVASICALYLSDTYQTRSLRSSTWVTFWLGVSCLLNIPIVRTRWLQGNNDALASALTAMTSIKAVTLILENLGKRGLLLRSNYSSEEVASPLNRLFFIWALPVFREGYRSILSLEQLPAISADLQTSKSQVFSAAIQRAHKTLFQDLVADMPQAFFAPVAARLFLIGFSLAQPFLVHTTLDYVINLAGRNQTEGSLLIGAYVFVFGGFALSNALFWYSVTRLKLKARSRLIEMIYDCLHKSTGRNPGNNVAVSLMTVDVEVTMMGLECFHDIWASVLQIAAAVGILGYYMSAACAAPVAACSAALLLTIPVVIFIQPAQANWNAATAERITLTTAVLNKLRDVRLLGLGGISFSLIQRLREREIVKSARFRRLLFLVIFISQSPLGLSPLVTFIFYATVYGSANPYIFALKAFTALNLIGLIVTPFTNLLQALPIFGAGIASLARIQDFVDTNMKQSLTNDVNDCPTRKDCALEASNASFSWTSDAVVVKNVNLQVANGSFLAVAGPVASGKSTLLAGLLGLTPNSSGKVARADARVSFCPQTPWIFSGTIRENITCGTEFDQQWYDTTIAACALVEDVKRWTHGDLHNVGNDGRNLSGGQRQRVALARAVYARNSLVLLDDTLSGLDSSSSQHIQREVLGKYGLFRRHRSTVIMVSNLTECLSLADEIVVLAKDGSVAEQGEYNTLSKAVLQGLNAMTSLRKLKVNHNNRDMDNDTPPEDTGEAAAILTREDIQRKAGDWSVYYYYMKACGRFATTVFLLGSAGTAVCYQVGITWVKWWSTDLLDGQTHSISYHLGIYTVITVLGGVALILNAGSSMVYMVSASAAKMHTALLSAVARAPVSHFGPVDTGVTVNRFNQDLRMIDWELPLGMVNALCYVFICITQAVVIACASRYMAISVVVAVAILVLVQRFYLKTSRQLRLLDIEAKAPLYTNFHETIHGIPTLRAYGSTLEQMLRKRQQYAVNRSQQPMYLLGIVQRWLALVVDLIVSGLAMVLIILVIKDPSLSLGDLPSLGAGLVNLTLFNQFLTYVIRFWTDLENSLGAISRIKNFAAQTPTASGHKEERPDLRQYHQDISLDHLDPASSSADIQLRDVTAHYDISAHIAETTKADSRVAVLDDVTLEIPAGSRVAVVGRSGSGKSTLLSLISRILPASAGSVFIGGTDITTLDQEDVQRRIICVTQDFLFLPELSLKDNLDLSAVLNNSQDTEDIKQVSELDNEMIDVLKSLGMWDAVNARDGLTSSFDLAKWSVGELQLLNLARAVLKRRRLARQYGDGGWRILLLDEVTSSVDRETAALIRNIINKEFVGYTVIAVEHRLENSMKELDWVVRMDQGRVVEKARPADAILERDRG